MSDTSDLDEAVSIWEQEFIRRRTVALVGLRGQIEGWWWQHLGSCPETGPASCECGMQIWFRGPRQVMGVDSSLHFEVHGLH